MEALQAALDDWVVEYNTGRPHQSCGGRPPAERFALAGRSLVVVEEPEVDPSVVGKDRGRPSGVSRWVDQRGTISLAGFRYAVGPTFAGEPVEVVVTDGWSRCCMPGCWSRLMRSGLSQIRRTGHHERRFSGERETPRPA